MALFNKLFTSPKNLQNKLQQDNISEKLFAFSKDQVRCLLFRECDFRGRKLLFDSRTVKKMPIASTKAEKFVEISNGFGYVYSKPQSDCKQLSEMVFGSVAMSFRGTYFKIHSLIEPNRFMFTQVFPSPRQSDRTSRLSSRQSFEHSSCVIDVDSGASSNNSTSGHLSVHSDTLLVCRSQQLYNNSRTAPLEVPCNHHNNNNNLTSGIGDSGCCCADHSTNSQQSSLSSSLFSNNNNNITGNDFSSSGGSFSYNKRWLRRTSMSLDYHHQSSSNSDDLLMKSHSRHSQRSRLGLAIILELTLAQEDDLSEYLMEHVALLESMLWRARQLVELAYIKSNCFVSLMMDVTLLSSKWLVNLLSGSYISMNLWLSLSNYNHNNNKGCDNLNSINSSAFIVNNNVDVLLCSNTNSSTRRTDLIRSSNSLINERLSFNIINDNNNIINQQVGSSSDSFFNFEKFLKSDCTKVNNNNNKKNVVMSASSGGDIIAERFIYDFCELLEAVDIKDTKFFMSTLVTAVLTYHLGWVTTCLPSTTTIPSSFNDQSLLNQPASHQVPSPPSYNSLWGQLTDLYGSVGHPTKLAQTIITGAANRKDIITKMLNSLTYFIRCCDIERKHVMRADIDEENKFVETICHQYACIPKENYKKYEDHLREIMVTRNVFLNASSNNVNVFEKLASTSSSNNKEMDDLKKSELKQQQNTLKKPYSCKNPCTSSSTMRKGGGLSKTQTCLTNLSDLIDDNKTSSFSNHKNQDKVCATTLEDVDNNKLCRMHNKKESGVRLTNNYTGNLLLEDELNQNDVDDDVIVEKVDRIRGDNVIFVLGDDEELVGLKKNKKEKKQQQQRPTTLNLTAPFNDCDFIEYDHNSTTIKPSTSWTSLQLIDKQQISSKNNENNVKIKRNNDDHHQEDGGYSSSHITSYVRSQSMPPSDDRLKKNDHDTINSTNNNINNNNAKPKFRYSGVKFSLQQYPQILSNYMRSKNLEMSNLHLDDKSLMFDQMTTLDDHIKSHLVGFKRNYEEEEALQTPSNASELESTSDWIVASPTIMQQESTREATESTSSTQSVDQRLNTTFMKRITTVPSTTNKIVEEFDDQKTKKESNCHLITEEIEQQSIVTHKMKITNLPMPKSISIKSCSKQIGYASSLMRPISDCYMPDMVLQGTCLPNHEWESKLKNDLALVSQHSLIIDQPIQEAVAIVANTDTWEVQLISSHTYVVDKGSSGIRVGMSQLVANMLESLLQMWKLKVPPQYCLMHIEQRLQEVCIRSKALAQLLLATELCSMELLTSTLHLEVNDVPLLLAVASTHSPQVTQKYGLSFQ